MWCIKSTDEIKYLQLLIMARDKYGDQEMAKINKCKQ
jgi:hypothetical protein